MYKSKYQFFLFIVFLSVAVHWLACTKSEQDPYSSSELGLEYYPVAIGNSWVYAVDSIVVALRGSVTIDSSHAFVMEYVADSFRNATQQLVYRVDLFYRRDSTQGWELIGNHFIEKNNTALVKREGGLDFTKLIFPVEAFSSWDGNSRIHPRTQIQVNGEILEPYADWRYVYNYKDKSEVLDGHSYPQVCKVTEVDDENLIEKRFSTARYAKNTGLIYREVWILDTQNTNQAIPFQNRAEKGFILRQKLISFCHL